MLCDKCKKNEAVYHSKVIINGVSSEEHLCSDCSYSKGNSFADFTKSIFSSPFDLFDSFIDYSNYNTCKCGTSITDIVDSGKVGCNNCYANYKNILDDAVKSIKKGVENKRKEMTSTEFENNQRLSELKLKLTQAIEVEDYELACKIKKDIDALRGDKNV